MYYNSINRVLGIFGESGIGFVPLPGPVTSLDELGPLWIVLLITPATPEISSKTTLESSAQLDPILKNV